MNSVRQAEECDLYIQGNGSYCKDRGREAVRSNLICILEATLPTVGRILWRE